MTQNIQQSPILLLYGITEPLVLIRYSFFFFCYYTWIIAACQIGPNLLRRSSNNWQTTVTSTGNLQQPPRPNTARDLMHTPIFDVFIILLLSFHAASPLALFFSHRHSYSTNFYIWYIMVAVCSTSDFAITVTFTNVLLITYMAAMHPTILIANVAQFGNLVAFVS